MGKNYAWNHSTCACEFDKHCEIDEYLKNCTCVKIIIGDLVIACDEILDTQETMLAIQKIVTACTFL